MFSFFKKFRQKPDDEKGKGIEIYVNVSNNYYLTGEGFVNESELQGTGDMFERQRSDFSQTINAKNINNSNINQTVIRIDGSEETSRQLVDAIRNIASEKTRGLSETEKLFIKEKVEESSKAILINDMDLAQKELKKVETLDLRDSEFEIEVNYQWFILSLLLNKDDLDDRLASLGEKYKKDAEFLIRIKNNIDIESNDLKAIERFSDIGQACALNIMFEQQKYDDIIYIYEADEKKKSIPFWNYYAAISYFNEQVFDKSNNCFGKVFESNEYNESHRLSYLRLVDAVARIQDCTMKIGEGEADLSDLSSLYEEFCALKGNYKANSDFSADTDSFIAATELQTLINLSPELFKKSYDSYCEDIRNHPSVIGMKAAFEERQKRYDEAIEDYKRIDWENNEEILFKLLYNFMEYKKYAEILDYYNRSAAITHSVRVRGIWLIGICQEKGSEVFEEQLSREVNDLVHSTTYNLQDLVVLSLSLPRGSKDLFDKYIYLHIKNRWSDIFNLTDADKISCAGGMLDYGHLSECEEVLRSLKSVNLIVDKLAEELFQSLYVQANNYINSVANKFSVAGSNELDKVIALCDWFIGEEILTISFLQLKINCLYEEKKKISALEESKKLFNIQPDQRVAMNIIALLGENGENEAAKYQKYINYLKDSDNPEALLTVAQAHQSLGDVYDAALFEYKTLYAIDKLNEGKELDLNDQDGRKLADIFVRCFYLEQGMIAARHTEEKDLDKVNGSVVVTLRQSENDLKDSLEESENSRGEDTLLDICLDSESDFQDEWSVKSRALGIKHYNSASSEYHALRYKATGDEVRLDGKNYKIEAIVNRSFYMGRYIFSYVISHSKELDLPLMSISLPEKSISDINDDVPDKQKHDYAKKILAAVQAGIREFDERQNNIRREKGIPEKNFSKKPQEIMLEQYHNLNDFGVPVEAIISFDYDNYLSEFYDLLFNKDQALYAGFNTKPVRSDSKYVLTLSSIVLMYFLDCFDLLDDFKDRIIVPASLLDFLRQRTARAKDNDLVSPTVLQKNEEGEFIALPRGRNISNTWNGLHERCCKFLSVNVSERERIDLNLGTGINGEVLFGGLKIDKCQLDSYVICKKENATLVSDDIFYRRLAGISGIDNTSFPHFFYTEKNLRRGMDIAMSLSKTNYVYTPLLSENMSSLQKLVENLLTGERKALIYDKLLRAIEGELGW